MDDAPLILTLRFDDTTFVRLDALRRAHFPPARNHIPAHLTLFHALPGEEEAGVAAALAEVCAATPALPIRFSGLLPLGRGVALSVEAPALRALRTGLAARWSAWLTRQDAGGFRPHVTVQNKVAPEVARELLEQMRAAFEPWDARGEGLLLWRYRGGPWEAAGSFDFRGELRP
ncbi:2'-5' RNA ligase family protein [Roseomonas sp. CCTCC AB2023176]|uniref:2'-5' RNA ligase family protein n=1 Tax=Roseomonas sp. CCTCC AB2023176 TaxID=3342640 RepID=UPI0035D91DBC